MSDFSKYDSKIYSFLNLNKDWLKKADTNRDGILINSEFTSYFAEKIEFGDLVDASKEKDILASFFSRIFDSDKSSGAIEGYKNISKENALDKEEQKTLNRKIESYGEIYELLAGKCPSLFNNEEEWINKTISEIFSCLGQDFSVTAVKNNINKYMYQVSAKMLLNDCINSLKQSGGALAGFEAYTAENDTVLTGLVEGYVKKLFSTNNKADFNEIILENDVKSIINQYLEFCGLGSYKLTLNNSNPPSSSVDIYTLSSLDGKKILTNNTITLLQKNVAVNELNKSLTSLRDSYKVLVEKYEDIYNQAISEFIDAILDGKISGFVLPSGSWENANIDWDLSIDIFKTSNYANKLDNIIKADTILRDGTKTVNTDDYGKEGSLLFALRQDDKCSAETADLIVDKIKNGEYDDIIESMMFDIYSNDDYCIKSNAKFPKLNSDAVTIEFVNKIFRTTTADYNFEQRKSEIKAILKGYDDYAINLGDWYYASGDANGIYFVKDTDDDNDGIFNNEIYSENEVGGPAEWVNKLRYQILYKMGGIIEQNLKISWDSSEAINLFNQALYSALVTAKDKCDIPNITAGTIIPDYNVTLSDLVVDRFCEIMNAAINDSNVANYFMNADNRSLVAGVTTYDDNTMGVYGAKKKYVDWEMDDGTMLYKNNSTKQRGGSGDDWGLIYYDRGGAWIDYDLNGNKYKVIAGANSGGDETSFNTALKNLLDEYIKQYSGLIDAETILKCFVVAECKTSKSFMKVVELYNSGTSDNIYADAHIYGFEGEKNNNAANSNSLVSIKRDGNYFYSITSFMLNVSCQLEYLLGLYMSGTYDPKEDYEKYIQIFK